MLTCGAGSGIFLLTRESTVLLLSDERLCRWGSPYLDNFGEEVIVSIYDLTKLTYSILKDLGFHRGKKLKLERSLYEYLRQTFAENKVDSEILRGDVPPQKKARTSRKW